METRPMSWSVAAAIALACIAGAVPAAAEGPQEVVDNATRALEEMAAQPNLSWFHEHARRAQAIVIVPTFVKAGFVFGGAGGNGVVLMRGPEGWSHPAFVTLGSVTAGLQVGAQAGQLVLFALTEDGRDALLADKFQLGADASIAVGPVGVGAQAVTADLVAFSRSAGLFVGATIEGGSLAKRDAWNARYYGAGTRPLDILELRSVGNPGAGALRAAAKRVSGS